MVETVHGKTLAEWRAGHPELERILAGTPALWINPDYRGVEPDPESRLLNAADIDAAAARLERFAPYLVKAFPETREAGGLIESPLRAAPRLARRFAEIFGWEIPGRLLLKCDNELAISGSIKARGGIYEVLKHAESLALERGLIGLGDDYARFAGEDLRALFNGYAVAVGSTGNLGLSIGIIGAALGLRVTVHMSADARQWKKDLLRQKGVDVVEHVGDYGAAVREGRAQAGNDASVHFVDDENSTDLFLGYAVAARRLRAQLDEIGIAVDAGHPLFVYLPCGVGGGPGGIAFGLKAEFGEHAHCFFAEPTESPCMLLGLLTGLHDEIDVREFGLSGMTEADGLAVARPSGFVGRFLRHEISGVYTIQDEMLFRLLALARDAEGIALEPSAAAGMTGPAMLSQSEAGQGYLRAHHLWAKNDASTHVVWATGGSLVPTTEMDTNYRRGFFACS